jgi:hypothetical protein
MRYIEIDGKMYRWRDLLKLRREQRKAERQAQPALFLNSKTTSVLPHNAPHHHVLRRRRFLSESYFGGTFLSTP